MKRTKEETKARLQEVCNHFVQGGKVLVKDTFDGVIKESEITGMYRDNTVILGDCIDGDYSIFKITLKPL